MKSRYSTGHEYNSSSTSYKYHRHEYYPEYDHNDPHSTPNTASPNITSLPGMSITTINNMSIEIHAFPIFHRLTSSSIVTEIIRNGEEGILEARKTLDRF